MSSQNISYRKRKSSEKQAISTAGDNKEVEVKDDNMLTHRKEVCATDGYLGGN